MKARHFISMTDLSPEETLKIIHSAIKYKTRKAPAVLEGKTLALIFEKPSLRTRVSFEVAITQLGGRPMYLSPAEVGIGQREPAEDVACVLGRLVDGIIARTFAHDTVKALAFNSGVPVINALSDFEHPCQALADILTIYEKKGKFKDINLAYVGDGNNVANSLILAATQVGMNFLVASPRGYEIPAEIMQKAREIASQTGSRIFTTEEPEEVVKQADVIYTDVWTSMGQEKEAEIRRAIFKKYQVNQKLISLARPDVMLMHPLPAHHGEEVDFGVIRLACSAVFDQAENRMHAQKSLLLEMFSK